LKATKSLREASMAKDHERSAEFDAFFRDNYPAVLAYALARADRESAKDAVAAAFLVAWRRHGERHPAPRPWLYNVTRRTLADQRRAETRLGALRVKLAAQPFTLGDGIELSGDAEVLDALAELRPLDQEVLRLVAWEGLEGSDLATALGVPRTVAAVRLHRARKRLRDVLTADSTRTPVLAPSTQHSAEAT
jgi:RNA polymerase sigma-70 factor (ECF subfamily)